MDKSTNEKLDVSEDALRKRLEKQFLIVNNSKPNGPPSIAPVGQSKLLERVKTFLPKLQAAENELQDRIKAGENLDIEDCQEGAHYVEMNVGILSGESQMRQNGNEDDWSADSDPDSPLGSSDFDNEYTSDTDPDSSSPSSASTSSSTSNRVLKLPNQNNSNLKRVLIEEVSVGGNDNEPAIKRDKKN